MAERSVAELQEVLAGLKALDYRRTYQQFYDFRPYRKQKEFLTAGASFSERLLIAGNQNGKTHIGAYEAACHLTGLYPDWWNGRRFDKPTRGWIAGETSLVVRDVQQKKLCGEPGVEAAFGTGMIPKDLFVDKPSLARGITDAYDTIQVRHVSGGVSVARFKSYEQGRQKFQGETLDWLWFDEEPPMDIYSEGLTRTAATRGITWMTFTPLQGATDVVGRFLDEPSPYRTAITMTIEDAEHISREEKDRLIASWPAHEREARSKGVPMLGSGRIFPIAEEAIAEPAIEHIPPHWFKIWGVDFGIDHPFAAVLVLFDRDADVLHLHHTIRVKGGGPLQHAVPMKAVAAAVPVAWPHDGNIRGDRNTGETMAQLYRKEGLLMLHQHSTWPDGGFSTEAGIMEMQERMATGRFKAARHLADFFEEFRMYHRKDGQIVKERDDILSAIMKAVMMKRFAKQVPLGGLVPKRPREAQADGLDFPLF